MALNCQEQRICEMFFLRPPANAIYTPHSRRSGTAVPAHAIRIVPRKTRDHLRSVSIRRNEHHIRWNRTNHRFPRSLTARLEVSGIISSHPALTFPPMLPRASASSDPGSRAAVDRVAIVGGGLGGLAAAIALRKQGIDAQVSRFPDCVFRVFFPQVSTSTESDRSSLRLPTLPTFLPPRCTKRTRRSVGGRAP